MKAGEELRSKNGDYTLKFQKDLNLVVYYRGNKAIWSSGVKKKFRKIYRSYGSGNAHLLLQNDGNAVTYISGRDPKDAIWAIGTNGKKDITKIIITNEGIFEIHDARGSIWSSKRHNHIGYLP